MNRIRTTSFFPLSVCLALTMSVPFAEGQISALTSGSTTPTIGARLTAGPIALPSGFMTSVKSYGAVGNGVTDDTAAIQKALADGRSSATADYFGKPKALYFPPGVYLVHETLEWVGCCVTLQGDGTSSSIIRLAPGSAGFNNAASPKPLILTPAGNESFHQNIWDLGIEVGANNPGATAVSYISNNSGSMRNVSVKSDDGKGIAGIDLTRNWAGPLLIANTEVQGFNIGISLHNAEYGTTLEDITVANQKVVGIQNVNQPLEIEGLLSTNSVPALTNTAGFVVLLNATLGGGTSGNYAIQTSNTVYLRNVASSGYGATLENISGKTPLITKGTIKEFLLGTPMTLIGTTGTSSLNLPVEETPSYTSATLSDWEPFVPKYYGDTSTLQAALNSGKSTVYFPFGTYFSFNEVSVTVPDTVDRIVGFSSVVNGAITGYNGGSIRLVVTSNSTTPLIVEKFGYGLKIDHVGSRPVVLKDTKVAYTSAPGAGNLFLDDVESAIPFTIQQSQHVWARQLNDEVTGTKISSQGKLWILGLKTEGAGTVINTESGAETELLGGLVYPAGTVPASNVAFTSDDAQVSYMYTESVYCTNCGYSTQVQQTSSGTTKAVTTSASAHYRMPLFIGYN